MYMKQPYSYIKSFLRSDRKKFSRRVREKCYIDNTKKIWLANERQLINGNVYIAAAVKI